MPLFQLRNAARMMGRRPATSALVVATMALGVGASTALFSVVDAVLLRQAPFANAHELVELWTQDADGSAYPRLDGERAAAWTTSSGLFARIERYTDKGMLVGGVDEPEEVRAASVTTTLFQTLGVAPASGRVFTVDDAKPDAPAVAIVSEAFYRKHLAGGAANKPRMIRLDDRQYTVVGVMPASFRYPRGLVSVWLPMRLDNAAAAPNQQFNYLARLEPGLTRDVVRARFKEYGARLSATSPRKEGWAVAPMYVNEPMANKDVRTGLWILAAAVVCLLLIACVNAANLLLMQATTRQRELAIRGALGASRATLLAQLLLEALVLAALAAAAGVAIAYWAVDLILMVLPKELSIFANANVEVDARVLAFAVIASIATWLVCSVGPAIHASRARQSLVTGDRSGGGSRGVRRVRNGLVVLELALALMLLAGTGLFTRSLSRLVQVDPGFDVGHTVVASLAVPLIRFPRPEQRAQVLAEISAQVRAVPGVRSVTFATGMPPNAGIMFGSRLEADGAAVPARTADIVIPFAEVDSNFFSTLGVSMVYGRTFTSDDLRGTARVAVIDPQLANTLWPGQNPVGRRFRLDADRPWMTVVGVSGDLKLMGADDRRFPFEIYLPRPVAGRATRSVAMAVRTAGPPSAALAAIKRAIRRANPDQPITALSTADDAFAESFAKTRFVLTLMACFAGLALVLAVIGVYAVLSYAVVQRTREIGIRMALGARDRDVLRALMTEGARSALSGVAFGLVGVLAAGRLARTILFEISPNDGVALISAAVVLLVVALCAVLVPARRASRVSPVVAISAD